jgi:hypothetical protein
MPRYTKKEQKETYKEEQKETYKEEVDEEETG